jgi:C4-dicarboxylate transporter, DctM subunit
MSFLGLLILIFCMLYLAQPLFVILGAIAAYSYVVFGEEPLTVIIEDLFFAANREVLIAIPLFILAGNLMTHGGIAQRLINLAKAVTAPIPSGLAIGSVGACAVFAAISGSSPVTLIAIGSMMYPALIQSGYSKKLSVGMLSAGGTLGIIIPPSIPMIIFAVMAGVSVTDLFLAGLGPGILICFLLMLYAFWRGRKMPRGQWNGKKVLSAFRSGVLALLMPFVILGGIYSGFFTATESAAIAVAYALIVEFFIHRELRLKEIPKVLAGSAEMLGTVFLILVFAVSLNKFLTFEQVPQQMVEVLQFWISSPITFLIGVNLLLLLVGCFMDIMSAILILAPLLTPIAIHYGIDPVHFGIMMIVNLEIGYLTPPMGINLFVASGVFKEPLGAVIKAVIPVTMVLLVGLIIITFWPGLSLMFR